jgi:alkylation response protein AidB-like acyl-CoA dehydrogenase
MRATEPILKPDHGARRRHFIFTDDHERLRESIHAFVVKELQPHADEWELNTFDPVREISMAKLFCARVAVEVADDCIQIHGGAGYMKEYGVERVWRDMRLNRIGAGTDEIMLEVIGRSYGL